MVLLLVKAISWEIHDIIIQICGPYRTGGVIQAMGLVSGVSFLWGTETVHGCDISVFLFFCHTTDKENASGTGYLCLAVFDSEHHRLFSFFLSVIIAITVYVKPSLKLYCMNWMCGYRFRLVYFWLWYLWLSPVWTFSSLIISGTNQLGLL